MEARDAILGNVCVERGWISPEKLADCIKEAAGLPLAPVLARKRLIPEEELDALRAEIAQVLKPGPRPAQDREEDLDLAHFLRDAGQLSQRHLDEALALQKSLDARGEAPRLRATLLERCFVTLSELQAGILARRKPGVPMTCRSCKAASTLAQYDAGRMYLCKACTGELVPTAELRLKPAPAAAALQARPDRDPGKFGPREEIGRGGMGTVYKTWDETHRRWVALKVIKDRGRMEDIARFRREIDIARALHHPNIVALYEVAHVGDEHQIVMQYIDGRTLADLRLRPKPAAELIAVVAQALQYSHSHGVVHRDIKPHNIMIDREGKPYLMDFGLAKSDSSSSITSIGFTMGTPSFLAPEQALGRSSRVDRRSDVYSLGAVLYYLVTGEPPFRGETAMETLQQVVDQPVVPPSQRDPSVPSELETIILTCMQKDRNDRYPTARALADVLERFASREGS